MPKTRLKSLKPYSSLTVNPEIECNGSLERYNPPLHTYKVSRIPQSNCNHGNLPKSAKTHFGCLGCWVVNSLKLVIKHSKDYHATLVHVYLKQIQSLKFQSSQPERYMGAATWLCYVLPSNFLLV
jgi:hypothetical protein